MDVLNFALSGATAPDGDTSQVSEITDRNTLISDASFKQAYDGMIAGLFSGSQKGVLITIPPVTVVPFFRAVSYNRIVFTEADSSTINLLNSSFANFNGALDQLVEGKAITAEDAAARKVSYKVGANAILIVDNSLIDISVFNPALAGFGQIRPAAATDLMLLSAGAVLGTLADADDPTSIIGVAVPLDDKYSLTPDEQLLINTRTALFNAHIQSKASDNIAIFDFYTYFLQKVTIEGGFNVGGQKLAPDFSPNGVFSTDGIHPNARGNAIIANEIMKVIEGKWGASLPRVSTIDLPGVTVKAP